MSASQLTEIALLVLATAVNALCKKLFTYSKAGTIYQNHPWKVKFEDCRINGLVAGGELVAIVG